MPAPAPMPVPVSAPAPAPAPMPVHVPAPATVPAAAVIEIVPQPDNMLMEVKQEEDMPATPLTSGQVECKVDFDPMEATPAPQTEFRQVTGVPFPLPVQDGKLVYRCKICTRPFKQKWNLQEHVLTHTGEKPHKCPTCGQAFRQKVHLRKHIFTHQEEHCRPHLCAVCGKRFITITELKSHRRKHHPQ